MKTVATALVAALLLPACTDDAVPLTANGVRITKPLPGSQASAGYFELVNTTAEPIRLVRVSSPQFGKVEMHETIDDNGIARMVGLDHVTIAPHSSVVFEPGGKHLMLMQPVAELASATLEFHADGALVLAVTVQVGD